VTDSPISYVVPLPPRVSGKEELINLLKKMEVSGGSDIYVMGGEKAKMDLYGKKVNITDRNLSETETMKILMDIYGDNAQAKLGTGIPIDTSFEFSANMKRGGRKRFRYRVNATACFRGGRESYTITIRSIPTTPPLLSELGVEQPIIDAFNKTRQGLILVVGATGNGKSTLLASLIRGRLENPDSNDAFVTIESPIEFVYDDIDKKTCLMTQSEIGSHIISFSQGIVNSLRMAPDCILVGEARDEETIESALEASSTGHAVYSTVHSNNVADTFRRMISVFDQGSQQKAKVDLIDSIKMIVAQRLVPSVDGKRIALREYLVFDDELKSKLILSTSFTEDIRLAIAESGQSMVKAAKIELKKGTISENVYDEIAFNYSKEIGS